MTPCKCSGDCGCHRIYAQPNNQHTYKGEPEMNKTVTVIRGDGIGPEIVNEAIKVMDKVKLNS